jgi:hypothetical protein
MRIETVQAIDVHAHYGRYHRHEIPPLVNEFMSADPLLVAERARRANTQYTIVSPYRSLLPRGEADASAGNDEAAQVVPATPGLLQWVVIHPLQPRTYEQAERMLQDPTCVGIKIHPEEHLYPIADHGRALFEFAARHRALVLAHSGQPYSLPNDFVPFANEFPEMSLILAHLGNGPDPVAPDPDLQVRAIQAGRHDNVYVDTSSSRSIQPGLIEWAVTEVGVDRVLYGTDTPTYFAGMYRARIDKAELPYADKHSILRDGPAALLKRHGTDIEELSVPD